MRGGRYQLVLQNMINQLYVLNYRQLIVAVNL